MPEELQQPLEPEKASILALYRKEPWGRQLTYAVFVICFLSYICQNTLEAFAPGPFLIIRELLVVPILSLFGFGTYRMISKVSILPGIFFLIAAFVSFLALGVLRKEGVANAIAVFLVEGLFFGLMIHVLKGQSTKPTRP